MEVAGYQRLPKLPIFRVFRTKTFPSSNNAPFLGVKIQNYFDILLHSPSFLLLLFTSNIWFFRLFFLSLHHRKENSTENNNLKFIQMKELKVLFSLFLVLAASVVNAQNIKTIHLEEGDSLGAFLGEDKYEIDSLIITGKLDKWELGDVRDIIKNGRLRGLNLEEADCEEIGAHVMISVENLWWITWPKNIKLIEYYSFYNAGLKALQLPPSQIVTGQHSQAAFGFNPLKEIVIPEGYETIGNDWFAVCDELVKVVLPSSLRTIGVGTFAGCTKLAEVSFPEGLEKIGFDAFYLTNLKEVDLSKCHNLKTIEYYAFGSSSSLQSVKLPEGLKLIEYGAFENTALQEITIPSTVDSIDNRAFSGCKDLKTYRCMGQTPPRMEDLDVHDRNLGTIYSPDAVLYVPKGCRKVYGTAPYWRQFMVILEMDDVVDVEPVTIADKQHDKGTCDLQGRRMAENQPLRPGIYVKDGRKFVVK